MKNRLQSILEKIEDIEFLIAHDYDSVDDETIETVLRVHIPTIKLQVEKLLSSNIDDF